ncbi:MAG: YhdH/YhfP family quinone oxidoreductase [Planctomycetota bacterium]
MPIPDSFPCLMVRREGGGEPTLGVEEIGLDDLPAGDVVIEVAASSLNYKDALACRAHPGVVRDLPHVPGIDCAGTVAESGSSDYAAGDAVLVTGYALGAPAWGGWSRYVRVPAEWVVPLPAGLTVDEAMTLGTAGFTAAQCVAAIDKHGVQPGDGEVVVTGATGGVGVLAVAILAKLGYRVTAVTGKADRHEMLRNLGAEEIVGREAVDDRSDNPMLRERWAAAVDTVGGNTLATIVRGTRHRGCVTACGLVGGDTLPLSVYPFILRGVGLLGIDSAKCPRGPREFVWRQLSGPWKPEGLDQLRREADFRTLPGEVEAMLAGGALGRLVVRPVAG